MIRWVSTMLLSLWRPPRCLCPTALHTRYGKGRRSGCCYPYRPWHVRSVVALHTASSAAPLPHTRYALQLASSRARGEGAW